MWSGLGAALIGGGLSVGGSLLGSALSADYAEDSAETAFRRQLALLQLQQDYATRMSNSAHQREIQDLRKAGLNPILSATGGQGASSPVVSAPSVGQAAPVDFGDLGLGKAADLIGKSSAFSLAKKQAAEVEKNSESQRALNQANASSAKAQAALQTEQIKTEKAKQEELKARTTSHGKRNIFELPAEALKYIDDRILNSAKGVTNNSYYFYKDMKDIGRDVRNDLDSEGRFNISPRRVFERFGKMGVENSMIRSGFGY